MPLSAGTLLGPYEIVAPIGAGGMGEVYRAVDTRLDRTVAIKVLHGHMVDRADLRQRFEREARAISSLNHPNICTLYDVGHHDDLDFLVMEHLEGQSLSSWLSKGPLSRDEVLHYAIQIAAGLECAHRQGVTHRDLKPGNVIVTKHGAKLVDFGLARVAQSAPPVDVGSAATQTQLTSQGTILGTLQYMAPEQLEGQTADARSDIFSFGAVLYEMSTGRRAFEGKSAASLIAAIMHSEPVWDKGSVSPGQAESAPDPLTRVIKKCLAKDPDRRWQTVADLKGELEWIAELPPAPAKIDSSRQSRVPWIVGAGVLCAALVAGTLIFRPHQASSYPMAIRFQIRPPENTWWEKGITNQSFAISPEGGELAFIGKSLDATQIWIRPLGSVTSRVLTGTEGVFSLFWAPDSRSLVFYADHKLKRIAIAGGPAQVLAEPPEPIWGGVGLSRGDFLVFGLLATYRVSTSGIFTAISAKIYHWPELLPDDDHLLYRHMLSPTVWMDSLASGETIPLFEADSRAEYAPALEAGQPGTLLYIKGSTLTAHRFADRNRHMVGEPIAIDERVPYFQPTSAASFSVSKDGILVYAAGEQPTRLVWVERKTGKELEALRLDGELFDRMRLSPDGQKLAVSLRTLANGGSDIWIYDLGRRVSTRFTFDAGVEAGPQWSPDGKRIAFGNAQGGTPKLFWKAIGEAAGAQSLSDGPFQLPTDWSRDGRFLFFQTSGVDTFSQLWVLPFDKEGKPGRVSPLIQTAFSNCAATLSPDGKWIAFASDETGHLEVYVQEFHGEGMPRVSGERLRVSTGGGVFPRWRADGTELFFVAADNRLMAAPIKAGADFHAGEPVALFRLQSPLPLQTGQSPGFEVSSDGQRFLIPVTEWSEQRPLTEVVNWQTSLPRY
jgi:serine/threonine protein kinase